MEDIKDDAIHHTAMKLAEEIKNLSIYKSFYSDVQKLVSSPNVKKEDFKQTLQQAMKEKGLDTKLRNTVFHWVRTQNKNKLDPLTSLSKASAQWEKRIHKSLNSMCSDLETSLAKIRPQSEQEELADKWHELSTYSLDLSKYRPVYAPKDFLDVLLTLSGYVPFTRDKLIDPAQFSATVLAGDIPHHVPSCQHHSVLHFRVHQVHYFVEQKGTTWNCVTFR